MSLDKVSSKPSDVFTATVRGRKSGAKSPEQKRTLYIAITREQGQALRIKEGETLTLGILKRMLPAPETDEIPLVSNP